MEEEGYERWRRGVPLFPQDLEGRIRELGARISHDYAGLTPLLTAAIHGLLRRASARIFPMSLRILKELELTLEFSS
jgi:hypothetical protein